MSVYLNHSKHISVYIKCSSHWNKRKERLVQLFIKQFKLKCIITCSGMNLPARNINASKYTKALCFACFVKLLIKAAMPFSPSKIFLTLSFCRTPQNHTGVYRSAEQTTAALTRHSEVIFTLSHTVHTLQCSTCVVILIIFKLVLSFSWLALISKCFYYFDKLK